MTGRTTVPGRSAPRRAFAVLWFGQCVAIAGLTTVVPVLPFYLARIGVPGDAVPWWTSVALAGPAVTQIVSGPLWGWVGDRYGRKAMVVRAQGGLALALGLMALADTAAQFVACRLVQGAFGGVASANAAFASTTSRADRQGRAFGGLMSATAAGSLAGPLLGSGLAVRFGFGALFACVAVLMTVSALCSAFLLTAAPPAPGPPAGSGFSLRTAAHSLWRQGNVRLLLLAGLATQAGVYALVVVFAPRMAEVTDSVHDATMWVGGLQAVTWGATLVGGVWWGRRNDRSSPHRNFVYASVGCAASVALQAVPDDPVWFVPLRLLQGFCFAALLPSVQHVISQFTPGAGRGTSLAVAMSVLGLGQVVGPPLGAVAAELGDPYWLFGAISVLFVTAALLAAPHGMSRTGVPEPGPRWTRKRAVRRRTGRTPS